MGGAQRLDGKDTGSRLACVNPPARYILLPIRIGMAQREMRPGCPQPIAGGVGCFQLLLF